MKRIEENNANHLDDVLNTIHQIGRGQKTNLPEIGGKIDKRRK